MTKNKTKTQATQGGEPNALKVSITGSYHAEGGNVVDYEFKDKIIPFISDDKAHQHLMGRYALMWVRNDRENYPERIDRIRECYVESIEEVEAPADRFTFVGKDIMELSFEEIQDAAVAKDLLSVPLFRTGSLREQRLALYREYSKHVLGKEVNTDVPLSKLAKIHVDGDVREQGDEMLTNEEFLEQEGMSHEELMVAVKAAGHKVKGRPTRDELLKILRGGQEIA